MSDKIKADSNLSECAGCHRPIRFDELYGAHALCSQCLAADFEDHHGG